MSDARHIPSDGIVFLQVVALKTNDVSDELLSVLGSHSDEAGVETVGIAQKRKRIEPQHLDWRLEANLVGQQQREAKHCTGFVDRRDSDADAAAAEVEGCLNQLTLRVVCLGLNAEGQKHGDAIKLAAFSSGWL